MRKLFLLPITFLLFGCTSTHTLQLGDCTLNIEIAETQDQIERGLMYRDSLSENSGMFFRLFFPVGPKTNEYFYMENMSFPIEMLFFGHNLTLKDIQKAEPCYAAPCAEYRPRENAWYVLEVPVGTVERCNARLGTSITQPE